MPEPTVRRRRKLGPFHWAVVVVWFVLAGWLLVSVVGSVVSDAFFGDGPVKPAPTDSSRGEGPAPPPSPDPGR